MRRLLVTGGAGFIGANFVQHWLRRHPADDVVVIDALTYAGNRRSLAEVEGNPRFHFVHADITDAEAVDDVMEQHGVDVIVHCAAESHVDRSIVEPGTFVRTNVVGTQVLLDAARRAWCRDGEWREGVRFHHVSTDEVFGALMPDDPPFHEETPYAPRSPYAASKAASDHLARAYAHTYGLPLTVSNCSNNYGPYQFPEKLIPLIMVRALDGLPLPLYGDGRQVRDWLYVADHCRALERILCAGVPGRTYNVGGGAEETNLRLVRALCLRLDARLRECGVWRERFPSCPASAGGSCAELITHVRDRPGHDRRYAIDGRRTATELGFTPFHGLATGLDSTVSWYLDHEEWWRAVLDGTYHAPAA